MLACRPVRFSRNATRLCCRLCAWQRLAGTRGSDACRPACGRHQVTVFLWTTTPALSSRGGGACCLLGGPRGRRPRASRLLPRSAAARRARAVALWLRFAWSMGRHRTLRAEA